MTDLVLECRDLCKDYAVGPQNLRVLNNVQLHLQRSD